MKENGRVYAMKKMSKFEMVRIISVSAILRDLGCLLELTLYWFQFGTVAWGYYWAYLGYVCNYCLSFSSNCVCL